ncbi:MAG: hypothetical protein RL430_850 [Actinomycetota bacterium]
MRGDPRRGNEDIDPGEEARDPVCSRHIVDDGTDSVGEACVLRSGRVVGDADVVAAADERLCNCPSGDGKAVHRSHCHQRPPVKLSAIEVKSAMKIPTAAATHRPEMIQNLMMTVVSGQPTSSK